LATIPDRDELTDEQTLCERQQIMRLCMTAR